MYSESANFKKVYAVANYDIYSSFRQGICTFGLAHTE